MAKAKFPKSVPKEWILVCPLHIREPKHYRRDGTCRCNDTTHQMTMRRWGFRKVNGKWQ
jgi:hypothetical protein